MPATFNGPLRAGSVWRGAQMREAQDWIYRLLPQDLAEIDRAMAHARTRGVPLFETTAKDFPLGAFGERLAGLRDEIEGGRGFQLLRGLPVGRYSLEENRILAWGVASHIGSPEPQDREGRLMHDITDTGQKVEGTANVRGFQTNDELHFHNDGGDAFFLLCLRTARSGGTSKLASVGALFNEILARRPDLAEVLQEPFYFDARAQAQEHCQVVPIFIHHAGHLSALYKRRYIETAQRFEDVPRLTPKQVEALDLVDAITNDPDFHLSFDMEPGDVQIGNNYAVLHSRTNYEDYEDSARRRHLLRIWMTLPNGRPLPEVYGRTREFGPAYARRMAGGLIAAQ
jgi:hypothetical protein